MVIAYFYDDTSTTDGPKRLVGYQVDNPVSVEEKVRAVKDLTLDDEVAVQVTASLLSRPETASSMPAAERVKVVKDLTRDDEVAASVTSELLQRPRERHAAHRTAARRGGLPEGPARPAPER
ncbi:DUF6192 family protein [Streptomyces sp. NPDC101227]|uniref:DUF6192 family protein n=1 Tax=Streptomyces sp. NPDC101227 TaxID=3366136 RepID=UPI00381FE55D